MTRSERASWPYLDIVDDLSYSLLLTVDSAVRMSAATAALLRVNVETLLYELEDILKGSRVACFEGCGDDYTSEHSK